MLEKEYEKCPKHDIKLILGEFNAKIGQEEHLKPTIGMNSLHKDSNNNRMRLISFAASVGMVVGSTMFPHKNIHKVTWKSPDGNTTNQTDHKLIDIHHKSNLQDTQGYRGANMDSDHFLIIAKLRNRINKYYKKQRGNVQNRYDIEKLQDSEIVIKYKRHSK
jgi:hypothetical protein